MFRKLIILGAGGLAREMALLVSHINAVRPQWDFLGYIGEPGCLSGQNFWVMPILGDDEWLLQQTFEADLLLGVGYPRLRQKIMDLYLPRLGQFQFPNLVHPRSDVDLRWVNLGFGNVITSGCVFTCNISVGNFNLFNLNSTIGHDAVIGNMNVINPGCNISGGVQIGHRVLIGTGAQVLEQLTIGDDAQIGAGAVVTKNVEGGQTVVGIPAKPRI